MRVITRTDRSVATALLHLCLRPFAEQLTKIDKVYEAGSPRLTPPKSLYKTCNIQERKVADIWIYDVTAKEQEETDHGDKRVKRMYYFAGGSWQSPPKGEHFKLLASLAHGLSAPAVISLISHPLAPNSPAKETFPQLVSLYHALSEEASFREEIVCFGGDSSGGNLALALTLYCLGQESEVEVQAPHSLFLICPTVNLMHDNPEILKVQKYDPIECLSFIQSTARIWSGGWDKRDPRLSPVLADVTLLSKYNVHVNGILAGYDVLSCEAKTFVNNCERADVDGKFLIWDRQMHVFPIMAPYHLPEAVEAVQWMVQTIEESMLHFWTEKHGKNAPGKRHGHRFVARDARKILVTENGQPVVMMGRDSEALKMDAGLARSGLWKDTQTQHGVKKVKSLADVENDVKL